MKYYVNYAVTYSTVVDVDEDQNVEQRIIAEIDVPVSEDVTVDPCSVRVGAFHPITE